MKKIITVSIFLCFVHCGFAQQLMYSKVLYDTLSNGIQATGVVKSFHNGYIIIGGSPYDQHQALLMKVDTSGFHVAGNRISHYTNGIYPLINFYQTITTLDSNYILCGSVYDSTSNLHRGMLLKFDEGGTIIWAKQYAFSNASLTLTSLSQTNDSGFVMCGYQTLSNINHEFVAKTDANGLLQWDELINASGSQNDEATSVVQLPDSTYMLTGCQGGSSVDNAFLTKLDKNGTVLFSKQFFSSNNLSVKGSDIILKNDAPVLLIDDGNYNLIKMDVSGNMVWEKTYQDYGYSSYAPFLVQPMYTRLHASYDNGFYFMTSNSNINSFYKVDSLGNFQHLAQTFFNIGVNAVQANDSGFFIVGNGPVLTVRTAYGSNNAPQIGIIKTDTSVSVNGGYCISDGSSSYVTNSYTLSSVSAISSGTVTESNLPLTSQLFYFETRNGCIDASGGGIATHKAPEIIIYPNPANSTIKINAYEQMLAVKIVDVLGNLLLESNQKEIDISALADGVYFLQVGNITQKFIVQH